LADRSVDIDAITPQHYLYKYKYYNERDFAAVKVVLEYLYTGAIEFQADNSDRGTWKGLNNAEDIFIIAHDLQYSVLMQRAVTFLRESLIVENVMSRLTRAYERGSSHKLLLEMYENFFYENWNTIFTSRIFDDFHETADIPFGLKFGEWFGWGMLNRATIDEREPYDPEKIFKAFVEAQLVVQDRAAKANIQRESRVGPNRGLR